MSYRDERTIAEIYESAANRLAEETRRLAEMIEVFVKRIQPKPKRKSRK